MAKKREPLSPEDLIEISKSGVKRFVRYDEGRQLYSMGETDLLNWPRRLIQDIRFVELFCVGFEIRV